MPWSRATAGLPTALIGTAAALPPPPEGLHVVAARCGPQLDGLLRLGAAVTAPHPVERLLAPVHQRMARDLLPAVGPPEVPALPENVVLLLEGVERAPPESSAVIKGWIESHHGLPLVLVARGEHPLLEALERVHGQAAVVRGEPTPTHLSREVVALALLAEEGPVTLQALAEALGQTVLSVRAALVQAQLSGIELDLADPLQLDPAVRSTVVATAADKPMAPSDPATRARLATAIGAWSHALTLYQELPDLALEAAALWWAQGDLAKARTWAEQAPEGPDRNRALAALAWDAHLPQDELNERIATLPAPEDELALAAAQARSGDVSGATDRLMRINETAEGQHAIDALHLLAKLPLMGPGSLVVARRFAGEAFQKLDEDDAAGRARLRETNARLTLRARNVREAARLFLEALPLLQQTRQPIPFARAVAGLAASLDLVGRTDEVLDWLDKAMRANRDQPHGLTWCNAALDTLMDRIEIDDGHTLSALQRKSLELATIRAGQDDPTPLEDL